MTKAFDESEVNPPSLLLKAYQTRRASGELQVDAAQESAVRILAAFADQLDGYRPVPQGLFARMKALTLLPPKLQHAGLYLYGDVGRGKSMLMDLFFATVNVAKKRRVHFHQFMLEIHERLHRLQKDHDGNVLPRLARELSQEIWLLCFDEFHVSNIADAMILGRLFQSLIAVGVVIVTTSNWSPDELYKNGLQRDRFLPFIDLLKERMLIQHLGGSVDHRYEQLRGMQTYFWPLCDKSTRDLQGIFLQLTNDSAPETLKLPVQGRTLKIVHAAKGVGFFNFDELCVASMGAPDYLAISSCLHTVILDGVPLMRDDKRNETIRFINLIDALYESKVKFFMAAEASPAKLAPSGEYAFPFQRTISRLMEMQGEEYRQKSHLS